MAYDRDELVCPPEPKPIEDPMFRKWREDYEREERARQAKEASQKAAYEKRTRDYTISQGAVTGGNPYEGEE